MTTTKHFGIWMDTLHATIVGSKDAENGNLSVLAHVKGEESSPSSSSKNLNNQKQMHQAKFFKEISGYLKNATLIHATGTGQVQEQFIHFLAGTPQFKNTKTEESTANKMSDEKLVAFFAEKFNVPTAG